MYLWARGPQFELKCDQLQIAVGFSGHQNEDAKKRSLRFNGQQEKLCEILYELHETISTKYEKIPFMSGGSDNDVIITKDYFEKEINPALGTFFDGKIYVDLEVILDQAKVDNETKEDLHDYFAVDKYLEKQNKQKFETAFEQLEKQKIQTANIKEPLIALINKLKKEESKFAKKEKDEEKNKKYGALQKLYDFLNKNIEKTYVNKNELVMLYQNAILACSKRQKLQMFSKKSENLAQLLEHLPKELKAQVLTDVVVANLPEKYQKTLVEVKSNKQML